MLFPLVDYRASSYKKIASSKSRSSGISGGGGGSSSVKIKDEAIVKSDVPGVSQVAIRGTAASNLEVVPVSKPEVGSPIGSVTGSGRPVSSLTQAEIQRGRDIFQGTNTANVSGALAAKLARGSSNPMSIRDDVVRQVSIKRASESERKAYKPVSFSRSENERLPNRAGDRNIDLGINISPNSQTPGEKAKVTARQAINPFSITSDTSKRLLRIDSVREASKGGAETFLSPIRGGYKILESEFSIRNIKPQSFTPDLNFRTAKRRTELFTDPDVQSAGIVAAGGIGIGFGGATVAKGLQAISFGSGSFLTVKGFVDKDPREVGSGVALIAGSKPILGGKNLFTRTVGERVPLTELTGGKVTSKTVSESLGQFRKGRTPSGDIEVTTVSPDFIKGSKVQAGAKGSAGIEDPGLYVAPKGRANLGFAGLQGERGVQSLKFNVPLLSNNAQPTISNIKVADVVRYPREAIVEPGFTSPKQTRFLQEEALPSGFAVITKRSEVGKGGVSPQLFEPRELIKTDRGLVRKPGSFYREAGTGESEAILPVNTQLGRSDVGLREQFRFTVVRPRTFTTYGRTFEVPFTGEVVRVPRYEVLPSGRVGRIQKGGISDVIGAEKVLKSDVSSLSALRGRSVSLPLSSPLTNFGNSRVSSAGRLSSGDSRLSESVGRSNIVSTSRFGYGFSSPTPSSSGGGFSSRFVGGSVFSGLSPKVSAFGSSVVGSSFVGLSPKVSALQSSRVSSMNFEVPSNVRKPKFSSRDFGVGSFEVQVRRRGSFETIGKASELSKAIDLGVSKVSNTAAATFRILRGNKLVTGFDPGSQFYSRNGLFIERSRSRISSVGELKEITFKGIASQRKRGKNSLFGGGLL